MTTITARYPGVCAHSGRIIRVGDRCRFDPRTRRLTLLPADPRRTAPATRSIVITIGDHEFIRNENGRCEDAPCCGCCTI